MAYQALYRAYRPGDFKSVAGQKHIVKTLQNAIKLNKVAHAYLFSGPRGTGKTTMAKIMAKALNCEHGPTTEPCNECAICQGITKGIISDIVEIDAASNNGVDEIRDLRDKVKYLPSECRYKVYIIDEVHMLSQGAFNALLKTLEEPPSHVIFILATTEPHKIPLTILSRCQRFDFQSLDKEDIVSRLKYVISKENVNVTDEAIDLISNYCEGGMRDALSLLDQSISYSTDDVVDANDVLQISGNVSFSIILKLLTDCFEGNGANVLDTLNSLIKDGKEIPRIINDIIIFLRDVLLYKINKNTSLNQVYNTSEYQVFTTKLSNQIIYHWLDILNETLNNIKFTTQKRAYLELGLLKMTDNELNDYQNLLSRITSIEQQLALGYGSQNIHDEVEELNFSTSLTDIKPISTKPLEFKTDDSFIEIKEIEALLKSAKKELKQLATKNLLTSSKANPNDFVAEILLGSKIGAINDTEALVILSDVSKCNRIMKDPSYLKAIEYINGDNLNIKTIYCLPSDIFQDITKEYMEQYSNGVKDIKLSEREIPVKKHIMCSDNNIKDKLINMFDENIVKIKEE